MLEIAVDSVDLFLLAVNTPQTKSKGNNDDTITAQHVKPKTESSAKIARIICSKVIFSDHCTYAVPRNQKETYFGWKNYLHITKTTNPYR